jgi:hypothetical protein
LEKARDAAWKAVTARRSASLPSRVSRKATVTGTGSVDDGEDAGDGDAGPGSAGWRGSASARQAERRSITPSASSRTDRFPLTTPP